MLLKKASIGMYSCCDYLLCLKNLVCVLFGITIPISSFNFIQLFLYLYGITCQQVTLANVIIIVTNWAVASKRYIHNTMYYSSGYRIRGFLQMCAMLCAYESLTKA